MLRIAIDGPGGAGKSTIAKAIAKKMNIDYVDTGAMYRAIGMKLKRENIDKDDTEAIKAVLDNTEIDFSDGNIFLDGKNVNKEIRTPEVSALASLYSAVPIVREKLVAIQRKMGEEKSVIMDGRDIGTNVLTNAEYKFFLTAAPEERAKRRYDELLKKGENVTFEEVLADINQRDYNDSHRKTNPLKKAADAIEIDSTNYSIEQVVDVICREVDNGNS